MSGTQIFKKKYNMLICYHLQIMPFHCSVNNQTTYPGAFCLDNLFLSKNFIF